MPKKLKIIYVIPTLGLGGAEKMLVDLVSNLDRSRFQAKVVCLVRGGSLVEPLLDKGIEVIIIGKRSKLGLGALFKLAGYLESERPDIVHTHLFGGDTWGRLAALWIRKNGRPIIMTTEHNVNLDEGFIKRFIKKKLSSSTQAVVAVSNAVKNYALAKERITPQRLAVIYNGVQLPPLPKPAAKKNGLIILGTIARLEPQKGQADVLAALAKLRDLNWEYWIIGDGSQCHKLQKLVKHYQLETRVKFCGWQVNAVDYLPQLDIFVLASRWEGQGIALIEAGLAGLPIVSTKVGGIPEVVTQQQTGLLVAAQNPTALAESLTTLIKDAGLRRKLGSAAKQDFKQRFSLDVMVQHYQMIYEDLAG